MNQQLLITDILKSLKAQYLDLVSDAVSFFRDFEEVYLIFERETQRTKEINKQIETILAFKESNGFYPKIKDQEDTEVYLKELKQLSSTAQHRLDEIEPKIAGGYRRRNRMLNEMADTIIEQTLKERDANRFITSMVLRAPLPNDQARCASNEKNKPIYIAALALKLLERLTDEQQISEPQILNYVPEKIPSEENPKENVYEPEQFKAYKREVLRPVVFAALIHQLGSYSLNAEEIYRGNRYRLLDEEERKQLIDIIYKNSRDYLKYALGQPDKNLFSETKPEKYQAAVARYDLIDSMLTNYVKSQHAFGNILRIPMIYASFLLSTKSRHNYSLVYKAYDIMKSGMEKGVIYKPYTETFMKMVGRFPMGTGIYFISKETNAPEKGVVIGLNPEKPDTAVVKQTSRRQIKYEDHSQTEVTFEFNLLNEQARKNSDFGSDYFKKQFPKGYYWNPAESWEVEINQKSFWRRDNNIRRN